MNTRKDSDIKGVQVTSFEDETPGEFEILNKKLTLHINTWMQMYENLDESAERVELRDVSIRIAKTFYGDETLISEYGSLEKKYDASAPYHFFLSTADNIKKTFTQPFSVAFHEILDHTIGELEDSLHINFMVEILWLAFEYMLAAQNPKMTIVYGLWLDPHNYWDIPFDITMVEVKMPEFGCHHSKLSILKYKGNKVRIIIYTANLYYVDWQTRTQGMWISPILPPLPEDAEYTDGESVTFFKRDFTSFLSKYKEPEVFGWEALIHRTDCSAINVYFFGSVPGHHEGQEIDLWGHKRLGAILAEHVIIPEHEENWPVIAQSSAVGVFGTSYQSWLFSNIVRSMSKEKDKKIIHMPDFKFIYPSKNNFEKSWDARIERSPLMYNEETHKKQEWIKNYMYQWKAKKVHRTFAMPHIKCYTRISPDENEIPWFALTSANLSKGAWGKLVRDTCYICNYEAGVVFIPQIMINEPTFPIKESTSPNAPVFLLPYDLPLTPYGPDDEPFVTTKAEGPESDESFKGKSDQVEPPKEEPTHKTYRNLLDFDKVIQEAFKRSGESNKDDVTCDPGTSQNNQLLEEIEDKSVNDVDMNEIN